jgi:hypothetical protein
MSAKKLIIFSILIHCSFASLYNFKYIDATSTALCDFANEFFINQNIPFDIKLIGDHP